MWLVMQKRGVCYRRTAKCNEKCRQQIANLIMTARQVRNRQTGTYVYFSKDKRFRLNKLDSKSKATKVQLTSQFNFARLFGRL